MSKSEKAIMNETLVALSEIPKMMVYRSNTGMGWQGEEIKPLVGGKITVTDDMVILKNARRVKFGIPGLADINGCYDGHGIQVEVKREGGRQSQIQKNFELAWNRAGGIYVVATSPEEAIASITSNVLDKIIG